jgi:hypothetical protein
MSERYAFIAAEQAEPGSPYDINKMSLAPPTGHLV